MLGQYGGNATSMLADMLNLGFPLPLLRRWSRGPLAGALRDYQPEDRVRMLLAHAPPPDVGLVNSMRYLDMKLSLAGGILVKVDRASMAVSLEVRPVFLHRRLMDLAGRIPSHLLADRKHTKDVLKQALLPWLPPEVLYRRKMGFAMPLGDWLGRDRSQGWLRRARSPRLDEVLAPEFRERLIDLHLSGRARLTSHIHSLAFLDAWLEQWQGDGELVSPA
jgi:asparagine synthase (glutamine-hydrolysing)